VGGASNEVRMGTRNAYRKPSDWIITLRWILARAIAQAVSRRPLTAEAGFALGLFHVIYRVHRGNGTGFSPSFFIFPVRIIPPGCILHISSGGPLVATVLTHSPIPWTRTARWMLGKQIVMTELVQHRVQC
jgi:hypothetical protein